MKIIHFSAECFPVAKVGGLADVVGALPKYQNKLEDVESIVIMPYVKSKFVISADLEVDFQFSMPHGNNRLEITVHKNFELGFPLYLFEIDGFNHREEVYGYDNDQYYFTAFQIASLNWMHQWQEMPDIVHCHDFHTGFIPFMMKHAHQFPRFRNIPSIYTIHNGLYQGQMGWNVIETFPWFDTWNSSLLEWGDCTNAMASAIKCAWKVNTVSPQYMKELMYDGHALAPLLRQEEAKCTGILNGIDTKEWNPGEDPYINHNYTYRNVSGGKAKNKAEICKTFGFIKNYPLIAFIGRFVEQKGVDVLADAIWRSIDEHDNKINFLIVGNGNEQLAHGLNQMKEHAKGRFNCYIGYNENLARTVYAGADFLVMPSRFEPCGLNQFYALRYGTIPIVRSVGGLHDSITDINDKDGNGIRFIQLNTDDLLHAFSRAEELYTDKKKLAKFRKFVMKQDFSWEKSAIEYMNLYKSLIS